MFCNDCPRMCGADRGAGELGFCAQGAQMRISRIALHPYEEPPISGKNGSGTVFFCGCSLQCVFCQNKTISRSNTVGEIYSCEQLADKFFELEQMGASNINLVTPTHFSSEVIKALELTKPRLRIPVVYNTSGYERVETLKRLEGLVDIYLPDFKYMSPKLAKCYSLAPDYPESVQTALLEMYRQTGKYKYSNDGTLKSGIMVRHLVLPAARLDSINVLHALARLLPPKEILLSLMSQYTPEFALDCEHKNLHRRLTRFEYESVLAAAEELGFDGFMQGYSSATSKFTPEFK